MQEPRAGASEELAQTTQVYLDTYIALELLHCSYSEYVAKTPKIERLMYQLYVSLKSTKEAFAQEEMERQAEADRDAQAMTNTRY